MAGPVRVVEAWSPPLEYVPRIIIKLRRSAPKLPRNLVLDENLKSLGFPLADLSARFSLGPSRRNYHDEDTRLEHLADLVKGRFGTAPEYETYIELACPESPDVLTEVVDAIRQRAATLVERVFVEAHPAPPPSPPPPPAPGYLNQTYLQNAPDGIGALGFWAVNANGNVTGPNGAGVTLADLEEGWDLAHPDLPKGMPPVVGKNKPGTTHGTRVLGLIAGQNDACRGIAFGANPMAIGLMQDDGRGGVRYSRSGALKLARERLKAGDVVLLETQVYRSNKLVPAEADELVFNEIQTCTALGITVIEAAGNDVVDIDKYLPAGDSGAVVVTAASNDGTGWKAMRNVGSRVHCFAQGTQVATIDPARSGGNSVIDETSAATAIVAGAATLLQSWAMRNFGQPLTPGGLRGLLADTQGGNTASVSGGIGVMPNLDTITAELLANGPV